MTPFQLVYADPRHLTCYERTKEKSLRAVLTDERNVMRVKLILNILLTFRNNSIFNGSLHTTQAMTLSTTLRNSWIPPLRSTVPAARLSVFWCASCQVSN